jgi:putative phosphoesterase
MRIGVLSDTHGLLRPQAVEALHGCEQILHAGDVGDAAILDQLRVIAPVTAIRGNVDCTGACATLPTTEAVQIDARWFYLLHTLDELDLHPAAAGMAAVIYGHTHRPEITWRDGVLFLNPGSAGPRRFSLPIAVAIVESTPAGLEPRIVLLHEND